MHAILERHAKNGFFANAYIIEGADIAAAEGFFGRHGAVKTYSDAGVDGVRSLKERASLAFGPARQFYLLNADALNWQSYPALLKLIEEPPAGHHFILCAASADSVPDTIRARSVLVACRSGVADAREFPAFRALAGSERAHWLEACAEDPVRFARMLDECEAWARKSADGISLARIEDARRAERTLNIGRKMCLEYIIVSL